MKATCCLLPLLLVHSCFAQEAIVHERASEQTTASRGDPTMPSASIRQRLQSQALPSPALNITTTPAPPAKPLPDLPDFDLKAIVLADADRGTALLVCNGRTIVVPLSRQQTKPSSAAPKSTGPLAQPERLRGAFSFQGQTFVVEDFSNSTLLLRCGERTLTVQ